jgi:N-acylglucosamine-6-phosphate 2-epimerase
MKLEIFLNHVRGRLIVSCQALADEPLHGAEIMARMALAAQQGGAAAIRANSPIDIRTIKAQVDLPLIGLYKIGSEGIFITPTRQYALEVIEAGADVVAIDATNRPRKPDESLQSIIATIHEQGRLVLADVSTLEEAIAAQDAGADLVAPTLSGYTDYSPKLACPDYALIQAMAQTLTIPVIAEGRIRTPDEARLALDYGAVAVVVGSAITRPQIITATFADALKK